MAYVVVLTFLLLILIYNVSGFRCDRRPYGSMSQSSPSDGRFVLKIAGGHTSYIPNQHYVLRIVTTDTVSRFVEFMISAEGDTKPDPSNPRRTVTLYPGELRPHSQSTAKYSDRCLYSVEQAMSNYKESVQAFWIAPPSGNGCVTLRAMVAENDNVWYENGSPLTLKICEDNRQPDDMALQLNENCQVCEEAKYEITFTGIWSRNTHPRYYPENDWVPLYSDLVGASHSADYVLWSPGTEATAGLQMLAEYANSSVLESEILEKVGEGARTLIKGKGHRALKMNLPTYALFRSDKNHHMVSVAVAISPSPDWFLGVARFELCQANDTWLEERELNLFLWDAGTDNGVSYESPNNPTFPQSVVTRVKMGSYDKNSPFHDIDIKDVHPFGTLLIKLVKTYQRDCEATTDSATGEITEPENDANPDDGSKESNSEPEEPSRYQNPDIGSDEYGGELPDSPKPDHVKEDEEPTEECPMTEWGPWSDCEGPCKDGMIDGYKWRMRDYVPVKPHKEPSVYCTNHYEALNSVSCQEKCPEDKDDNLNAEKRVIHPGQSWFQKREMKNK